MKPTTKGTQIRLSQPSSTYWRVTLDNPPLNILGPREILQFKEIITALESDEQVRVVVFDSAVEGFFLNHSDFLAKLEDLTSLPPGPIWLASLAGHPGASNPCARRIDRLNTRPGDWKRKRACTCLRHELCES